MDAISYVVAPMNKLDYINLSDIDLNELLDCAIVLECPQTHKIILGVNHYEDPEGVFALSYFYGDTLKRFSASKIVICSKDEFIEFIENNIEVPFKIHSQSNFDIEFEKDLAYCLDLISEKKIQKLVPVTFAKYEIEQGVHPISNIKKLTALNGSLYGLWTKKSGFLGVSPEPIYTFDNGHGYTKALAGTYTSNDSGILNDPKELNEHHFVVEDIVEKLSPLVGNICYGEPKIINYGSISHLQTDISFESEFMEFDKTIKALSPTAALGGYPKENVYTYMKQLNYFEMEKEERVFGGVLGIEADDYNFGLVAIRNLFWNNSEVTIHSGCGVVKESVISKELNEVRSKRTTIANIYE